MFLASRASARWRWISLALLALTSVPFAWERWRLGRFQHGGSTLGLAYGVAAAALILLLLAFGLRKRAYRSTLGSLESWLHSHVWLGLLALPLALFHSGLRFEDRLALWLLALLAAVLATGLFGVWAYQVLPRRLTAVESNLTAAEISERLNGLADSMARLASGRTAVFQRVYRALASGARPRRFAGWRILGGGGRRGATGGPAGGAAGDRELARLVAGVEPAEREDLQRLLVLSRQHRELHGRLVGQQRLRNLLDAWLYLHVPLSLALLVLLAAHVVAALYFSGAAAALGAR